MKKTHFLLLALYLLFSTHASAQYNTLNLWLKNGDVVKYSLADHITILATTPTELALESAGYRITYSVSDIRKFTVNNDTLPARIILAEGWNWMTPGLLQPIPVQTFTAATQILGETTSAINDPVLGIVGQLRELQSPAAYKINMTQAALYDFPQNSYAIGTPTVNLHQGWNWVGYPLPHAANLSAAFSGIQWTEGDCIAAHDAFAVYTDGKWVGSLQALTPMQGYLIKSVTARSYTYNTQSEAKARAMMCCSPDNNPSSSYYAYPNTMNIVAQLDACPTDSPLLLAYSGTDLRGSATPQADGRIYLTVHGNGSEPIHFVVTDNEGRQHKIQQTLPFTSDLLGTPRQPYILTLSQEDATPITHLAATPPAAHPVSIYTLSGVHLKTLQPTAGGSIQLLLDELPAGTYILRSGNVSCKVMKR